MALINCPECGKEISERSKQCVHCGYPLNDREQKECQNDNNICIINGENYNLSSVIEAIRKNKDDYAQKDAHKILKEITGLNAVDRGSLLYIIIQLDKIPYQFNSGDNWKLYEQKTKSCPKCGCTEFVPLRRKFSLLTGFATNKIDMVCKNCGYIKR